MKCFCFFIFSFILIACTRQDPAVSGKSAGSPEEVVRQFVSLSSRVSTFKDKDPIQSLCAGDLRRAFERMTEESFKINYLNTGIELVDLKVLESKVEAETANVRYQVTINNKQGTDPTKEINEREVALVKSSGQWLIDSIRSKNDQISFSRGMVF